MRIAVYENLPPGGALRTSYELGSRLVARGHEIDLYRLSTYADKGAFDLAQDARSVRVVPYSPLFGTLERRLRDGHLAPRSYTLFGPLRRLHRRLAAEIDAQGYDVALVHPDAMTFAPYALRWLSRTRSVYYCQEPPRVAFERAVRDQHRANLASSPYGMGAVRLLEDRIVMDRLIAEDAVTATCATTIAVNSVFSRERAWAAYSRNATVCYLGVDPSRFVPGAGGASRQREVLSIGAPISAKNHTLVVEALSRVPAAARPALRVILPRKDRSEGLSDAARKNDVELILETGIEEPALIDRYQHAIATVCAARLEPFGLTAVESMACGTPVVAIREGGFRESVVDGETGLLVEPDADSLAEAIRCLVEEPATAARMGAAARSRVLDEWTWDHTVSRMEAILGQAARG
ncbi:MAG TPA: glycosyltransferase family 4 protein [Candidatus Dormibacteraeota bacterium]|nr:glycosyltransferase family 4 protein [Candidatus Dormibacteraeota bacterium]